MAALLSAGALEDEAALYSKEGETVSVVDVSTGGSAYHFALFSDLEGVVLKEVPGGFEEVNDSAELSRAIAAYQDHVFGGLGLDSLSDVNAELEYFLDLVYPCWFGLNHWSTRTGSKFFIYTLAGPNIYPHSHAVLDDLAACPPLMNESMSRVNQSFQNLQGFVEAGDADGVLQSFSLIHSELDVMGEHYDNLSFIQSEIILEWGTNMFYTNGAWRLCDKDAEVDASIEVLKSLVSVGNRVPSDELAARINEQLAERTPIAERRRIIRTREGALSDIQNATERVSSLFSSSSLALTELNNKLSELESVYSDLEATTSLDQAREYEITFDAKKEEVYFILEGYDEFYSYYNDSAYFIGQADENVAEAVKKYGSNDERVTELQSELQGLRSQLAVAQNKLAEGAAPEVKVLLEGITMNATALSTRAAEMQPRENELDLVLVGGVVLLFLSAAGIFIYFKKYKEENAATIDIRELNNTSDSAPPRGTTESGNK